MANKTSKSANALYKEFVVPYYPETSFKEFREMFMQKFEAEKKLGYPEDSLVWLNAWFAENGADFIKSAEDHKNLAGEKKPDVDLSLDKEITENPETKPEIKTEIMPKLIWGYKPVYVYSAGALVAGFAILGIATYIKHSKKSK